MIRVPLAPGRLSSNRRWGWPARCLAPALVLCLPWSLAAQLPATYLATVFPAGGKVGTSFDVSIAGADLDDTLQLVFSHSGISATPKMSAGDEWEPSRPVPGEFTVQAGHDVPPGIYEVRALGRFGLSNPRLLELGMTDELCPTGAGSLVEAPPAIPLDTTINGRVQPRAVDRYRLALKARQRVYIDCRAQRIDSRLNAFLVLRSPDGREVAQSRSTAYRDAGIGYTAPSDGEYELRVADTLYGGGPEHFYRLTAVTGPHLEFVFPPAGVPGVTAAHTAYGHQLPAATAPGDAGRTTGDLEAQPVEIAIPPASEVPTPLDIVRRAPLGNLLLPTHVFRLGSSNPIPVYDALAPVVLENDSNDSPQTAQTISVPCEVQGRFFPARDRDWFQFTTRQGDVLGIEVFSHRLGIDTDPALLVQRVDRNDRGEEVVRSVAQADDPSERVNRIGGNFDLSSDDPAQKLAIDSDGLYRVVLRDQFAGWRNDPRRMYRLVIRPLRPDFALAAVPWRLAEPANDNAVAGGAAVLRRGGTAVVEVFVARCDGFDGDVAVTTEGLPAGVRCRGITVGGARTSASLVLEAGLDAPPWAGNVRVVGRSRRGDEELVREAFAGTVVWGTGDRNQSLPSFRVASGVAISVIDREEAPASVQVGEDQAWETSLGGKLEMPVRVARRSGFDGELKLVAVGLPNELKPADLAVPANAQEASLAFQATHRNAQPGVFTFYLRGDAQYKRVRNPDLLVAAQREQQERESQLKQLSSASPPPAEATLERIQELKRAADQRLADATKSHTPQDVKFAVVSTTVRVRIASSPLQLAVTAPEQPLEAGGGLAIPVSLERRFGFAGDVEVTVELPQGIQGVTAGKLTLGADQSQGIVELKADEKAAAGDWSVRVQARAKFNEVPVETRQELRLRVTGRPGGV